MKHKINDGQILIKLFKERFIKVIAILLIILSYILINIKKQPLDNNTLLLVLGLSVNTSVIGFIWFIVQIIVSIYFAYLFLSWEVDNYFKPLIHRLALFKYLFSKYLILEFIVILVRLLFYLFLKLFYFKNIEFSLFIFLLNIGLYFIMISMVFIIFIINLFRGISK